MSRHAALHGRAAAACRVRSLSPVGVFVKRSGSPASSAMHQQQSPPHLQRGLSSLLGALALTGALALAACSRKDAVAPARRPVVAVAVHADGHALRAASLPGEV